MKQEALSKLTEALESAGFELVSFREETYRHLELEKGGPSAFASEEYRQKTGKTGVILLELAKL
jgi:hypothetical protein